MAANMRQLSAGELAEIVQNIYNTGMFPTKNDIEQWIRENVEKIFMDAISNTANNDWEGTGNTYAGELIEVLMGNRMTNGALSSYLLTRWFSERGPGYNAIQNIVAGDIGTERRDPNATRKDVGGIHKDDYSDLNSILERNPSLLAYLYDRSDSSTYISNSSFNSTVDKSKCWVWLAKHAIEYRDVNIFSSSLKDMLFGDIRENQNLTAPIRKSTYTIDTGIACDSYQHAHIVIKCEDLLSAPVKIIAGDVIREEYPIVTVVKNHYLMFVSCDFCASETLKIESDKKIELVNTRII